MEYGGIIYQVIQEGVMDIKNVAVLGTGTMGNGIVQPLCRKWIECEYVREN